MLHENPDMELWVQIDQITTLVRKARALELKQYDFTLAEAEILYILRREDREMTLAEIAWWNCREVNSILIRVNKMLEKGLVQKSRADTGRQSKISITDSGRELYNNVTHESIRMVFETITEEEKQQLSAVIKRLDERTRELLGIGFKPRFLL